MLSELLFVLALAPLSKQAASSSAQSPVQTPSKQPVTVQTDMALQVPVQIEAKGRPLYAVLASLSEQAHVKLSATDDLRETRLFLRVGPVPLAQVMQRIQDVLGHGKLTPFSCEWERQGRLPDPPAYLLHRTETGKAEEEAMLDLPRTRVARWLRDWRDYALLPPPTNEDRSQPTTPRYSGSRCRAETALPVLRIWRKKRWQP